MPSALPVRRAGADGRVASTDALTGVGERPFGVYVHVPFCRVRCGYCDFNTYTADELGRAPGASRTSYAGAAIAEVRLARRVLGDVDVPVSTVFLGGGTPTLLPPEDLAAILRAVDDEFGLAPGAEVTTESNPDSVTREDLERLREAGFNRISFGMQSAVPQVLATLDRTHDPERVPHVVGWARAAGFEQISLDLIYGTPGESLADWETSVEAALAAAPDHVSAYALIVEDGTGSGPPGAPRRAADAGRRRPGRQVRPRRRPPVGCRASTGTRSRTGRATRRAGAVTTSSTGRVPTGGASAPVPTRTSAACAGGTSSTRRPTPTDRRRGSPAHAREVLDAGDPAGRAGAARDPAARRPARRRARRGGRRSSAPASWTGDCWTPTGGRLVLTGRGRLLADAVVRDLAP